MKKRNYVTGGHIILAVVELILLLILAVLSTKKNNLHYDNVEKFCYNIQEAGKLILPDYSLCEKYLIEKEKKNTRPSDAVFFFWKKATGLDPSRLLP